MSVKQYMTAEAFDLATDIWWHLDQWRTEDITTMFGHDSLVLNEADAVGNIMVQILSGNADDFADDIEDGACEALDIERAKTLVRRLRRFGKLVEEAY